MNKTKVLLVLGILGLVAAAVGVVVLHGLDQTPIEVNDPGVQQGPSGSKAVGDTRLRGETDLEGADRRPAGDREQVIEGHSGKLRRVRLQFRCETLRHNVAGVWNFLKLRVRVEDEKGQHLAGCERPWLPWTASIPVDVERIVLVAKGYKRKVIPTPATYRKGGRPHLVFLEPDALVRVHAVNLPWTPGSRFGVSARLATGVDKEGRPLLYANARPGQGTEALRGGITAAVKVPSGLAAMFVLRRTRKAPEERSGFVGLDSEVVTLKAGEEREITIDLRSFGVLEGRVTGLAREALKDQVLSLRVVAGKAGDAARNRPFGWDNFRRGVSGLPTVRGRGSTRIVLDGDGHFRVTGLQKLPFTLQLRTDGGQWPALEEVGTDRRQWTCQDVGFLVVEPTVPVPGVLPVSQGVSMDRPFKVQVNSPPGTNRLSKRIPLFTSAILEKAPLFFFVEGIGHFNRSLAGKLPDPDGLHRVEVPVPGGSLLVHVKNQPSRGLHLFARPLALAQKSRWISITGKRTGSDWRFTGLAAGDYKLVVNYTGRRGKTGVYSGRTLAETIPVKSGQETEVTIRVPDLLEIAGQVVNWPQIPTALTPRWLQLTHGGRPHTARIGKDGSFQLTVMGPWDGVAEITFFGWGMLANLTTKDITWAPAEKRLLVTFPGGIRERWVTVAPIAGGRLWMHTYVAQSTTPLRRSPRRHGRHVSPKKNNRFLVADVPGGVDVLVLEQVRKDGQNLRLVRGWFRFEAGGPTEVRLAPKGRFIQVAMATATGRATLRLKPPPWWQHPRYPWAALRLAGTTPQQFWLPDAATAILVDGKREIPIAGIGAKLVIE